MSAVESFCVEETKIGVNFAAGQFRLSVLITLKLKRLVLGVEVVIPFLLVPVKVTETAYVQVSCTLEL